MIRVVSLFCGIGGADLGLYDAADELGITVEVVDAIDSWEPAVGVYNANQRHPVARVADVKKLTPADLPPHDLIIGGPPCQDHSMAGQRKCKCNVGGDATERCCLADFVRLAGDTPYIMENVASRLISAPWSEKLCAANFGDVTSRKRWFYSNYLLHVIPAPGPRRIRDIRDLDEDARVIAKRMGCKAGAHGHYDSLDSLDSLSAHSWHGHDVRGHGKLIAVDDPALAGEDDVLPSLTRSHWNGTKNTKNNGSGNTTAKTYLRLGLRGNSASASASAFEDDDVLGSVLANSFHGNEASKLIGCRNPSLLEMARAHSIPDSWDWAGANKTQRGQMIANSWPAMMAKAICKAMLTALIAEREQAA